MTYKLEFTDEAKSNYWDLYEFIFDRLPQGAAAWDLALERSLDSLEAQPLACSLAPENEDHNAEIRQFFFKTPHGLSDRGLILVEDMVVYVLHLRGPGQDVMPAKDVKFPK
ncbi:MAG: hypothetical protein O3A00_07815 [Planctomycetota bacterium]|nr:hypothetical protein [Planctomycetota bacterium]